MSKSEIEALIAKVESAIAAVESSLSKAREKAAEIAAQFDADCESLSEAHKTYETSKSSGDYDAYAVIYQRLAEAKSMHDEIRLGFNRDKGSLKTLRRSFRQYRRMLAAAEDDPAQPSSNV